MNTTPAHNIIGRIDELRSLTFVVDDPTRNLIILRGPGGAGKTVLAEAVLAEARSRGALTGAGKYAESDAQSPYEPILRALSEAVAQALDSLYEPAPVLADLRRTLGPAAEVLRRAGFGDLGGPVSTSTMGLVVGATGKRESTALLTDAVLRLVSWLQGFNLPIVLLIDDWRRNAPESRALLKAVLEECHDGSLTLVVTERIGEAPHNLASNRGAATLVVGGLVPADREALLVSLLGEGGRAAHEWLGAAGPDLPFDVRSVAASLAHAHAISVEGGIWRVNPTLGAAALSAAGRSVGGRKNLGRPTRQLAVALAVWGVEAPARWLRLSLGFASGRFETVLRPLIEHGLVRRVEDRLAFTHDRIREEVLAEFGMAPAELAATMAERLVTCAPGDWPHVAYAALHLRQAGGLKSVDPDVWRDRFAQGAHDARRRLDTAAAAGFAECAFELRSLAAPNDVTADRLIVRGAMLSAADRRKSAEVLTRATLLVASARTDSELGEDNEQAIEALRASGDPEAVWTFARAALAHYGLSAPDRVNLLQLMLASRAWRRARRRAPAEAMDNEAMDGLTRTAHAAAVAAFERNPAIAVYIACQSSTRVVRRRRDQAFWSSIDVFLSSVFGDFAGAARLGEQALEQSTEDSVFQAATLYRATYFGQIWKRPLAELRETCGRVQDLAVLEGDLGTSAVTTRNKALIAWRTHRFLPDMKAEFMEVLRAAQRIGDIDIIAAILAQIGVVDALLEPGGGIFANLSTVTLPSLEGSPILMLEIASLQGDWARAGALAEQLAGRRRGYDSHPGGVVWRFHETLARLKVGLRSRRRDIAFVRAAAELNPIDHRSKLLVLEAEQLRTRGRMADSLVAYANAVRTALATAGPLEAGLACECAADAARAAGRLDLAQTYDAQAQGVWRAWGAAARLKGALLSPLESRLAEAESQVRVAEREGRAKSRFLADVAHELRTPMQGMQGLLDLAADEPAALDMNYLREVFGSLRAVVDDLTDFGVMGSGEARLILGPVSLPALVRSEVAILAPLARKRGGRMELVIADGLPAWVLTDGGRVRQVVRNLLSNALKYGEGVVEVAVGSIPSSELGKDDLVVVVEDSGPGLTEAELRLIFEPFERGAQAGDGRGLGLGLALSRRIAETMGGSLTVKNREAGGAQFAFQMPAPTVAKASTIPSSIRPLNILLAEDVDLVREVLAAVLLQSGHRVQAAGDGIEAWRLYCDQPFDLAIVDWMMPGLGGRELLHRMQGAGARRAPPVIVLTASPDQAISESARESGAALVLYKPVSAKELGAAIARLCGELVMAPEAEPFKAEMAKLRDKARLEIELRAAALLRQSRSGKQIAASDVHRLAGLAAQFGWTALADAADRLERCVRQDSAGVDRAVASLEKRLASIHSEVNGGATASR